VSEAPDLARLSIGKVLEELQPEFPDLSISKIRYLESEGLIAPERTASGYRKFAFADIERLRFILRTQQDFKPLFKIREYLDDMDRGLEPDVHGSGRVKVPQLRLADDGLPTEATFTEVPSQVRVSREDLLEATGISGETLDALEQHGLIERRPNQRYYDGDDLAVAQLAGELADRGLEPRHLRAFRSAAERQAALIDQALPGRPDAGSSAALAARVVRLHTLLVRRRIRG
jgi:DNA-binding transcriptional MerR regulator